MLVCVSFFIFAPFPRETLHIINLLKKNLRTIRSPLDDGSRERSQRQVTCGLTTHCDCDWICALVCVDGGDFVFDGRVECFFACFAVALVSLGVGFLFAFCGWLFFCCIVIFGF